MIEIQNKEEQEGFFKPHMAMTHNEINGGAANAMNKPIFMKAAKPLTKAEIVALEKVGGKAAVKKASYRNLQRMLERVITDNIRTDPDDECIWIWLKDFDETVAVFEYNNSLYAVNYLVSETGIVTLTGEVQEVVQQDVYVTDDGRSLVLKYKDSSSNSGEIIKKGVNPEDKGNKLMSQDLENQIVALKKEAEVQLKANEANTQELIKQALAKQAADVAKAELIKSTTELVKGFSAIDETDHEALVKSLVDYGDGSVLVIKALSSMQTAITKAKEDVVVAQKAADDIKAEFGNKDDEGIDAPAGVTTKGLCMKTAVAAAKAKAASNSK